MIRVKVEYQGENRFFHLPTTNTTTLLPSLDQLLSQHVLPLFHLSPTSLSSSSYQVKYRDHENDYITMDQEHEWREALRQQSSQLNTSTTSTNDQSFCCLHLKLVNLQHDNNHSNHIINQQYNNDNNENEATVTSHHHNDKTTATTNEKKKKNKDVTNDLLLLDDSATWYLSHLSHSPDNDNDHNHNHNDNDQNLTFHS